PPPSLSLAVSNLDVESKLCGHYQSAWHLQRNIFLPGTRPACVEELHHRAKQRLPALYRGLLAPSAGSLCWCVSLMCSHGVQTTADPDQEDALLGQRPKCPVPNVPSTLDKQTNWTGTLPLPTPEDRMKSQSRAIASCVVPIDVTGAGFDREASVRYSLVHSQSVLQRRRRPRRRKVAVGVPRRGHNEADSDESPVARERTVIVHASPGTCEEDLTLAGLNTRDSGCQTEDLLASVAAPSRRRIGAQRGRGGNVPLSHSTGNISSLPDDSDGTFSASAGNRLRSRSLPREGGRSADDDEEGEDELSPFETEDFLPMPGDCKIKDNIDGPDDKEASERQLGRPERQLGSLKFKQAAERQGHVWTERGRTRLPRKSDVESCEISSSSDTFSSPVHSNTGALASQVDHKDDHQSSSGNWSGSSSTCPSQTSETMPPAASPPLTGSSHCDSELSLNATPNASEDSAGVSVDPYSGDQRRGLGADQTESCASTATDMLDDAGVSTASEGEWSCAQYGYNTCCHPDFSPEHSRVEEDCPSLDCPSFTSIATLESLDRPPSEKADTVSHFSVDAEGYYTSMHFDCGLKGSKNLSHNYASADQHEEEHGGPARLGRCSLSLRKLKVKPSPPERSTSLKKISSHAGASAETCQPKITAEQLLPVSSKERKLQSGSTEPYDQTEGEEPVQLWGAQSSNDTQGVDLIGPTETHSFKDEGAVQADYADLWLLNDLKSSDPYHSLSNSSTATGTTVIECIKSQQSSESQTSQSGSRVTTPTLPPVESELRLPSPEKLAGLASPSSGYSSQSETPTSCIPLAFFPNPNPLSPTRGKRKPKVPERRSSLTSLRQHVSKGDLELPIIPPTHLNLSALHSVSKPLTYRNLPVLHQNKTKVAAEQTEAGRPSTANMQPDSWSPFAVTPMVLRSVQLRSVGKPVEGKHSHSCTDAATRPKCPKARKPPPCGTFSAQATFALKFNRRCVKQTSLVESTPSDPLVSPLTDDSRTEEEVFLSPSKSRTTEDLFAMIHRSKRKVFGRKDSGETPLRSSLSMSSASASPPIASSTTPVTPTTPTNSQRASGPLYRSIKKSSTSNEEFKLLLLKKGSRSDSSYRMSATEILKSPIAPRSFGDPQLEGSRHQEEFPSPVVLLSPERVPEHLPSPYPKAIVEGFSTKPFPTAASSRQGRSRIPPAASSSRYSTRSRLYTAPMQAISEGETENSDGSPHDDRSS
uniref:Nance-Horan syndrome a (congenital cataracts and dental anomalies) n=1 Tax=Electrophorus electricus TaxID=8005 RepID=A0A4W4FH47_ELEEL